MYNSEAMNTNNITVVQYHKTGQNESHSPTSLVSRNVEGVREQLRVDCVQLPEHLSDLVVTQRGSVGRVHDEDELDPGVGHVPVYLLLLRGEEGAEVQVSALEERVSHGAGKSH